MTHSNGAEAPAGTVIIGGGLAGLVVARELAVTGRAVTLFEERENLGGLIPAGEVGGVQIDLGADAFTNRDPQVTDYIHSLGLETVLPNGRSWIWDGTAVQIPKDSTLGVPADPESEEIRTLMDDPARVAADLTMDPHIGAQAQTLGALARARMGDELVDRLVAPIAGAIYSTHPDNLAIDPVLKQNFLHTGSLARAVAEGLTGPATSSVVGGMNQLPRRLAEQAEAAGARIVTGARVEAMGPTSVRVGGRTVEADHIVLATGVARAQQLLAGVTNLEPFEIPAGRLTTHVTLALRAPGLDEGPRGSGLLCVPGTSRAKALTHLSNKWTWLRDVTDLHLVRVSYPVNEQVPVSQALADASELLGLELSDDQVVDSYVLRWGGALTPATPELREWSDHISTPQSVSVTGVWKAGTGISAVVPHARATANRIIEANA